MSISLRASLCVGLCLIVGQWLGPSVAFAYPGSVDVRVLANSEALEGQARDIEQTLFSLIYANGGRIVSGFDAHAQAVIERAQRALEGVAGRLNSSLSETELRDLHVAVDTVEQHFRGASTVIDLERWFTLVRSQAILLAKMGKEAEARDRFVFLYNLRPDVGPDALAIRDAAVEKVANVSYRRWSEASRGTLLLKRVGKGSRIFLDGKPANMKGERVSGLRSGLHLVQVLRKGRPAFGSVVNVPASGMASLSLPDPGSAFQRLEAREIAIAETLFAGDKLTELQLNELKGSEVSDALLFSVIGKGVGKTTEIRGVWIHPSHDVRYFSMVLKSAETMRATLEQGLSALIRSK